jgi:hypothetical protein
VAFWLQAMMLTAAASCVRQRSGYRSAEFFQQTVGTAQASGFALPPQAWEEFSDLAPGTELVLIASDFDRRAGFQFEAVVAAEADGPRVLVLRGGAEPASADEVEKLERLLGTRGLRPSSAGDAYAKRLESLGRAIASDPGAGLELLAAERRAVFPTHASELFKAALGHESAGEAVLEKAAALCLNPPADAHLLRGYFAMGGARRRLEDIARHPKAGRALLVRIARDVVRERELVVLAVLERKMLLPSDLEEIAVAVDGAASGEAARILCAIGGHPNADDPVLLRTVERSGRLEFDADRRDVLCAVATGKRSAAVRKAVEEAAERLEFEVHRKDVMNALK